MATCAAGAGGAEVGDVANEAITVAGTAGVAAGLEAGGGRAGRGVGGGRGRDGGRVAGGRGSAGGGEAGGERGRGQRAGGERDGTNVPLEEEDSSDDSDQRSHICWTVTSDEALISV